MIARVIESRSSGVRILRFCQNRDAEILWSVGASSSINHVLLDRKEARWYDETDETCFLRLSVYKVDDLRNHRNDTWASWSRIIEEIIGD